MEGVMASELEMLQADIREVQAHLAVWPNDAHGVKLLAGLTAILESVTPPAMSHQRKSTLRGAMATQVIVDDPHAGIKSYQDPAYDPCDRCFIKGRHCKVCPHSANQGFPAPQALPAAEPLLYTFGADYEMDQRWLAADREKLNGLASHHLSEPVQFPPSAEPDRMMFTTVAFNLTSMHNLNYGTSRY
jgi:hypothetical protein